MRTPSVVVRSSDLSDHDYCAIKFYFDRVLRLAPPNPARRDAARAAGTARHEAHDADVAAASEIGRVASGLTLVGVLALVAMLLLGLAGCTPAAREETGGWFGALGAGLIVIALLLQRGAAEVRRKAGVPRHLRMLSTDAGREPGQLLRDERMGLVGRPDYVFTRRVGLRKLVHTAEVKPRPAPRRPYRGHLLQTAAAIHLARTHFGRRAALTGFLVYSDGTIPVTLTDALADELAKAVVTVRAVMAAYAPPERNHANPRRCASCPFSDDCTASLAPSRAT
jgi:CRISPR/Cas system-associated exonuclease Cas4 (RecB family)